MKARQPRDDAPGLFAALPRREGAFWTLLALAGPRLIGAGVTVALRRFVGPGVAGAFDLAFTPYRFLDGFRNFGTGPALIYERYSSREIADTAWTLNVLAAVAVTLVAQLLAAPIARYYGHPQIEGIFRLLSIGYVFASITSVHYFLLLREMNFRARSFPALGQVIVAGVVALLFALWGFRIGALVSRELASVISGAIFLWAICPYRPRLRLVATIASRLARYGVWIGGGLSIFYLSQNADVFIAGRIIRNTSDIGFYTTSWNLSFIVAGLFTLVSSGMVFPALSRLQDERAALDATLLRSLRQLGLVLFPVSAFLAVVAPVLIVPLLGEKFASYRGLWLVLSLLAIYAGNRTMLAVFFEAYKAIGKPWIVLVYNAVKLAVIVPAMVIGAQHGILGLAAAYIPIQFVEIPVALGLADRVLAIPPGPILRALFIPLVSTLVLVASVWAVEAVLTGPGHLSDAAALIVCCLVGVGTYVGAIFVFGRSLLRESREVLVRGL